MEKVINHFSHEHPLELSTCQKTHMASSCSGCKLSLSGSIYACTPCNYSLHVSCSQAAQLIHHPADPNHPLTLLPCPPSPQGCFDCNACGHQGTGFSYHCSTCNLHFHTLCTSMPLSLSHHAHSHPLHLAFSPPSENKSFSCNICRNIGSNHWLYRCAMCNFDAHTSCVGVGHGAQTTNMGELQARTLHDRTTEIARIVRNKLDRRLKALLVQASRVSTRTERGEASPLRIGAKQLLTTLSNKAAPLILGKRNAGAEEEKQDQGLSVGLWQKEILMGEKCRPLDFSGVIYYDKDGNPSDGMPTRSPRVNWQSRIESGQ